MVRRTLVVAGGMCDGGLSQGCQTVTALLCTLASASDCGVYCSRFDGLVVAVPASLPLLLCRRPFAANKQLVSGLSPEQKASLAAAATELAELFAANPTTDAVQDSLIASVLQTGSLAGMLQRKAGPLLHCGYALPPFQPGKIDLAWLNMTPASAQVYSDGLLQRINAANSRLFGPLPAALSRPVLLQSLIDLWCCDWDIVRQSFAAPAVAEQATTAQATAAVLSALLSGAQVVRAVAAGDLQAADRAAAQAQALAGAAASHVQQLQAIAAEGAAAAAAASGAPAALTAVQAGSSSGLVFGSMDQAAPASRGTAGAAAAAAAAGVPASPAGPAATQAAAAAAVTGVPAVPAPAVAVVTAAAVGGWRHHSASRHSATGYPAGTGFPQPSQQQPAISCSECAAGSSSRCSRAGGKAHPGSHTSHPDPETRRWAAGAVCGPLGGQGTAAAGRQRSDPGPGVHPLQCAAADDHRGASGAGGPQSACVCQGGC